MTALLSARPLRLIDSYILGVKGECPCDSATLASMAPLPSRRILVAASIMARAFTPNPVVAVLSFPWALISILPGTIRGGLYLDSTRTGMVMMYRSRPLLDILFILPLVPLIALVGSGAFGAIAAIVPNFTLYVVVTAAVLALVAIGVVPLLPRGGGSIVPWGPETPEGERWEIAGLAQMPGTRLTAIQLTLRVMDEVPPAGAVIVATAVNDKLLHQYKHFGFTAGPRKRVHKTVDPESCVRA